MNIKTEEAKLREEIEKKNKLHREQAKKLKIEHLGDNNWDDTIELEAKLQQLLADKKMLKNIFTSSYKKCYEGLQEIKSQKPRENNTPRDWGQRMDEILLNYSEVFDVSVIEAKQELTLGIKGGE